VNRQLSMARKSMQAILVADRQDDVHYGFFSNIARLWNRSCAQSQFAFRISLFSWVRWLSLQVRAAQILFHSPPLDSGVVVVDEYM
jgi:hypothetical protein